jgi:tetratricopeptide (TPR) repeat protein
VVNRSNRVASYRPVTVNNVTNNTSIQQNNVNQTVIGNQANFVNRTGYGVAGWGTNGAWYGHYHYLHEDWHHGGWNYWGGAAPLGSTFGWLGSTAAAVDYTNPYYQAPTTQAAASFLDYSQPISVPTSVSVNVQAPTPVPTDTGVPAYSQGLATPAPVQDYSYAPTPLPLPDTTYPTAPQPATPPPQPSGEADADAQKAAQQTFDQARAAFMKGDYPTAQDLAEQALRNIPGDATLHEFRALTLFAQGQYRDAAGAIYAVLAAGPGWNWDTLKALYPDVATYATQLRSLEDYHKRHADAAEACFLLAYHYLSLGSTEAAIKMLQQTVSLNPKDTLSPQLLKMLTQPPATDGRPQPGQ